MMNRISEMLTQHAEHAYKEACKARGDSDESYSWGIDAVNFRDAAASVEELYRSARQMDVTLEAYANLLNPPPSLGLALAHKALIEALKPFMPRRAPNDK